MPIFAKVITLLAGLHPNLAIAVAVPANVMPFVAPFFKDCPYRAVIMSQDDDKKGAIAACDFAIAKSGTVTLEVAMAKRPMIVTYRVNPLSAYMLKRIILTKYVTLINILQKREVVPELLQELCDPLMIASAAQHLLTSSDRKAAQERRQEAALAMLVLPGGQLPSDKAAATVLSLVDSV